MVIRDRFESVVLRLTGGVAAVAVLYSTIACSGTSCTEEGVDGLNVRIYDAVTGSHICDAMVTAVGIDGSNAIAQSPTDACVWTGAVERPGTYLSHPLIS